MNRKLSIREQLEIESIRKAAQQSPAKKLRLSLDLSNLSFKLQKAADKHEKSRKKP
jgi:putative hemolysin